MRQHEVISFRVDGQDAAIFRDLSKYLQRNRSDTIRLLARSAWQVMKEENEREGMSKEPARSGSRQNRRGV